MRSMKWKNYAIVFFVTLFIFVPSMCVHGFEADTSISQWDSNMIIEEDLSFHIPQQVEVGGEDSFDFFPQNYPIQNTDQPDFNLSISGDSSYWIKNHFENRLNVLNIYGSTNESARFDVMEKYPNFVLHLYFGTSNFTGNLFGLYYTANKSGIHFENVNYTVPRSQWIKMEHNGSSIKISQYLGMKWGESYSIPLIEKNYSLTFHFESDGAACYFDSFRYQYKDYIYYDYDGKIEWGSNYLGENASVVVMSSDIQFINGFRKYDAVNTEYNSSVVLVSHRNPFNYSAPQYSFYIAKIYSEDPYFVYSSNRTDWYPVDFGNTLHIEITYRESELSRVKIGSSKIIHETSIQNFLGYGKSFGVMYEGFTNESIQIPFQCESDGILPQVSYEIIYEDQTSISDYAYIEVYAENIIESKSGIYSAEGELVERMYNGYAKEEVRNTFGETEKNFIVLLYSLDGHLYFEQRISLRIYYFQNDDDPIAMWLTENWKWFPIGSAGLLFLGIVKRKKRVKLKEPTKNTNIKGTFYPNIGEVPKGCHIKNGALVCKKKPNNKGL